MEKANIMKVLLTSIYSGEVAIIFQHIFHKYNYCKMNPRYLWEVQIELSEKKPGNTNSSVCFNSVWSPDLCIGMMVPQNGPYRFL